MKQLPKSAKKRYNSLHSYKKYDHGFPCLALGNLSGRPVQSRWEYIKADQKENEDVVEPLSLETARREEKTRMALMVANN